MLCRGGGPRHRKIDPSPHHYRILREAGIISQRKEGVCFISTLRKGDLDGCFPGLLDAVLSNFRR